MSYNFLPKMNRVQLTLIKMNKRTRYSLTVLIMMMVGFSWYAMLYSPLNRMIENAWIEILQNRAMISVTESLHQLYYQSKNERELLQRSYGEQIKPVSMQEIIFNLLQEASNNNLTLVSYESGDCVREIKYLKQPLTINLAGDFESLNRFLQVISSPRFLLSITTYSIAAVGDNLTLSLSIDLIQVVNDDEQKSDIIN